jgi:hypothetical protein
VNPPEDTARELIEAYFSAVFEMVDPKIFADDLIACLSAKGLKIMARTPRLPPHGAIPIWSVALEEAYKDLWDAAP